MVGKTTEVKKLIWFFSWESFVHSIATMFNIYTQKKMFVNRNASTYPKSAPDVPTHHTINLLKH